MTEMSNWLINNALAIVAIVIALTAAVYARHAKDAAQHANRIAIYNLLRPDRLAVYLEMDRFAHYCTTFITMHHANLAAGADEIIARVEAFKEAIANRGPLNMPNAEQLCEEMERRATRMQRLADRLAVGNKKAHDPGYETGDENLEGLVDWFADQRKNLKALFSEYLNAPT